MSVRGLIALLGGLVAGIVALVLAVMGANGFEFGPPPCGSGGSGSVASGALIDGEVLPGGPVRIRDALPPYDGTIVQRYEDCHGDEQTITYRRFKGVAPQLAVAAERGSEVFVSTSRLTGLGAFPLARARYGAARAFKPLPRRCSRRRHTRRVTLNGDVGPFFLGAIAARGTPVVVEVERDTVVTGRRRFGLPDPRKGDAATLYGRECRYRDRERGIRFRAERIALPA